MQDKNIFKMSKAADTEIRDVPTLNILICYLLYKIEKPVETEQLYEIAVNTGLINYFYYQESIDYLIKNKCIEIVQNKYDNDCYLLTQKGLGCARELRNYAPKSYRDNLVQAALNYFARIKQEQEIKIEYTKIDNGYYVHVRCLAADCDLMELKLYAPELKQAKLIGEKIKLNPSGFYSKVMELVLSNESISYDLTDN